jgi:excisionase family DNA binding protein
MKSAPSGNETSVEMNHMPDNHKDQSRPDRRLLSLPETARELSVSIHSIRRLVGEGRLPVLRVGARLRVPAGTLDAWLQGAGSTDASRPITAVLGG